jgi:hypothetical protein
MYLMLIQYTYDIATKRGMKLSHVSIHNNSVFSDGNRRNLKISLCGNLVFVPFKSEEHSDGIIGEELKERINNILTNMAKSA